MRDRVGVVYRDVDSRGAPLEFGGSAYQNLAITASTSGFEKLSTALTGQY